ncbi:hypothetical protein JMJ77_0013116 [Colletotrichum scovillei]|uniref:Uncharacterized protein n=1 Tax=Colletotrichum scovillei TaxID=1209932 RepID=A0A9P7R532_9PEZI|nr:hypothetical protein JMJ77_0013116 [Colletotrichum scovillei]KAG7069407.1 hypothetical protein JMJ76_0003079 [Colletotrichum scovillei]KAG7073394.1 hypothetical protein JMJ78_0014370 [Colletotrichum scovillei]
MPWTKRPKTVKTRKRSVQTVSGSFILKFKRLGFAGLQEDGKWNAPSIKEPNRSGQPVPELVKMVVRETPVKLLARKSRPRRQPLLCSCKFWETRIGAHLESSRR